MMGWIYSSVGRTNNFGATISQKATARLPRWRL